MILTDQHDHQNKLNKQQSQEEQQPPSTIINALPLTFSIFYVRNIKAKKECKCIQNNPKGEKHQT